jgi:hypothetical protein
VPAPPSPPRSSSSGEGLRMCSGIQGRFDERLRSRRSSRD